ncbi:pogo transposable element with KRAB domain-like protein [Aphelenchoides avenae]|nr:pogo transposable element with KRAB domain-like protein [Aphelenchus avenae]
MLTASDDGARMKPLVLMPYGPKSRIFKKTNERFGTKLHLVWHNTTWMDSETTKIYLEKTVGGILGLFVEIYISQRGADDHLIHCLKEGNGIPNGQYELTKAREAAEAQELVEILAGFEIEAPDEDDTGHVSDVEVIDNESAASDDEGSGSEDENHNQSGDDEF